MAIVAHTPYTGNHDCDRTNEYLFDGHGSAASRTNRYLTDGHGQSMLIGAHNCPADPVLASEYMKTLRQIYEYQHPLNKDRSKGFITHQQLYVSPTEEDSVPAEERMEMMQEFITRTPLRDFACLYTPHDNTPDKHGHISVCPYSIPDENGKTHKLCMNNTLLNTLRREMDYICYEHGYSIVENPELWGDTAYREWFFRVKEEGRIKIHPPKECDRTTFKKDRNRSRSYARNKQSQALKQETQLTFYKQMTRDYSSKTAEFFYTPVHLYSPENPERMMHIKKYDKEGKEVSELELAAISMFCWAYQSKKNLISRKIPGSQGLQKRMGSLADKAFSAGQLIRELDIHTQEELITHIKECGSDIAELKQEISRQNTILSRMTNVMDAIDRWDNQKDEDALVWLKNHYCATLADINDAKQRYSRAERRKFSAEAVLSERSAEYRHLKEAEAVIRPTTSKQEWQDYLDVIMDKERQKKVGRLNGERLCKQLHRTGHALGITESEMNEILSSVKEAAKNDPIPEYWLFSDMIYQSSQERVVAVYDKIRDRYQSLHAYRRFTDHMTVIGPFSLMLFVALCFFSGNQEIALEREIEELRQEAILQKEYAKQSRVAKQKALSGAKKLYAVEVLLASEEELSACHVRFLENAATIAGRLDIVSDINERRKLGQLDQAIADATCRALREEVQCSDKPKKRRLDK